MKLSDVRCRDRANALLAEERVYEEFDRAAVFAPSRRPTSHGDMLFQEPRPELPDRERLPKRVALRSRI
jgi:hypothetical protein